MTIPSDQHVPAPERRGAGCGCGCGRSVVITLTTALAAVRSLERLRGCRIFTTGCTGFVGAWLLEAVAAANDAFGTNISVTVLTRDRVSFCKRLTHLAKRHDITLHSGEPSTCDFPKGEFTHVVHAAMNGCERVLKFAQRCGCQRLLLTSSGAVYAAQSSGRLAEDSPLLPATEYGRQKREDEWLCLNSDVQCVVARLFSFVGPHLKKGFAASDFAADAAAGGPVRVLGTGEAVRSYLFAADMAGWLLTLLSDGQPGRCYNVGGSEPVSVLQLAQAFAVAAGCNVTVAGQPQPGLGGDRYVPDVSRAVGELGCKETVPLQEAVRRTLEWHRSSESVVGHIDSK